MLSESSFIESSIFDLESGFSIVESGFLKRESEHEPGFFPSPGFLRVRVQVRVRVRSGFRSMPKYATSNAAWNKTDALIPPSSTLQIQKESPPDCSPCYLVQLGESRNIHTPLAVLIHLSKSLETSLHLCGINFLEVLLPSRVYFWREDSRSSSF